MRTHLHKQISTINYTYIAGGCGMVAMSLYTDKKSANSDYWGYAYGLGWTAWILAWLGCLLCVKPVKEM